jgi:diguanylate cyclase (GGDEF)-like protein
MMRRSSGRTALPASRLLPPSVGRFAGDLARCVAFLLAILCTTGAVHGAGSSLPPGRLGFRTYGTAQGLRNLAIEGLAQDSAGFLWVATQDGLYRYDGDRFARFGVEEGLPSSWVFALAAGAHGELWVGTILGLAYRDGNHFVAVPSTDFPHLTVNGLALDGRGGLWIASLGGLYRRSPRGFQLIPAWVRGETTAVAADPRAPGVIYAASGSKVGRLDAKGSWTLWDTGTSGERLDALVVDLTGRLWVSSTGHLLSKGPSESSFRDHTAAIDSRSNAFGRSVLSLDRNGSLWLPADSGVLHLEGGQWLRTGPSQGLPGDWAQGVFHDREGSLWTWQAGVGLYRALGRGLWESWGRKQGLPSDMIWRIRRDRSGELWVGTGKGLAHLEGRRWITVPGTERFTIRAIAEAPDGSLWLDTAPTGVLVFDPRNGRIHAFRESEGVTGRRVLDVLADHSGGVWLATEGAGLLHRSRFGGRFEQVQTPLDPNPLAFAVEDSRQRLWVGGGRGLAVRDGSGWRRFTSADGLLIDKVLNLTETPGGEFWVGYQQAVGISRVRLSGARLEVLEHRDARGGLTQAQTYFLGSDRHGRLWVGTGAGIDVLAPDGVRHFDTGDGVAGDDCDFMAFWADANGDVFVGTSAGLSRFRGADDPGASQPPVTAIVGASVSGKPLAPAQSPASFPHDHNTLAVRFSGLSIADESRLEYQVRLDGLERGWVDASVRQIRYAALAPGRYVFEARARIRPGNWGPAARLPFRILPAWWETWPLRLVEGLFAAMALFGLVRLRTRHYRARAAELDRQVAARTAELEHAYHRLEDANGQLARLASTDGLTGLANRASFDGALRKEWERALRSGRPLAVILGDVDHFKRYNDRYGHPAGDRCLQIVAAAVQRCAKRPADVAARYGGEEFVLVLPETELAGAVGVAERLLQEVTAECLPHEASLVAPHVTMSLGVVAAAPAEIESAAALLAAADHALYEAKENGRNQWRAHPGAPKQPDSRVVPITASVGRFGKPHRDRKRRAGRASGG